MIQRLLLLLSIFFASSVYATALPTYEVHIADGVFTPSSIQIAENQRIKIKIKNTGNGPAEFENLSLRVEKVLSPTVESFVIVPPLKAGDYKFVDEFHINGAGFAIKVNQKI